MNDVEQEKAYAMVPAWDRGIGPVYSEGMYPVHNVFTRAIPGAFGVDFLRNMIEQSKRPMPPMESTLLKPYVFEDHKEAIQRIDRKLFGDCMEDEELKTCHGWVVVHVVDAGTFPVAYILTQGSHIRSLGVRKMLQNKGIGSFLLKYVVDTLPKPITLNLDPDWNYQTLTKFYWKHGFDHTDKLAENGNEVWINNR
jgi:GNAT superfamily N-acetyltransferase